LSAGGAEKPCTAYVAEAQDLRAVMCAAVGADMTKILVDRELGRNRTRSPASTSFWK